MKKIISFVLIFVLILSNALYANNNQSGFTDIVLDKIKNGKIVGFNDFFKKADGGYVPIEGINWDSDDWDNDGIKNKDEINIKKINEVYYFDVNSNPFYNDTDYDGIIDGFEKNKIKSSQKRFSVTEEKIDGLFLNFLLSEKNQKKLSNIDQDFNVFNYIHNIIAGENKNGEMIQDATKQALYNYIVRTSNSTDKLNSIFNFFDDNFGLAYDVLKVDTSLVDKSIKKIAKIDADSGGFFEKLDFVKSCCFATIINNTGNANLRNKKIFKTLKINSGSSNIEKGTDEILSMMDNWTKAVVNEVINVFKDKIVDKTYDYITDILPVIKPAQITSKVMDLTNFVKASSTSVEAVVYMLIINSLGKEYKEICDVKKIKTTSGSEEKVYTIKEGKIEEALDIFSDYICAVELLADSYSQMEDELKKSLSYNFLKYLGNDMLKDHTDFDKEKVINSLKVIQNKIAIGMMYDKPYLKSIGYYDNLKYLNEENIIKEPRKNKTDIIRDELEELYKTSNRMFNTNSYFPKEAKFDFDGKLWRRSYIGTAIYYEIYDLEGNVIKYYDPNEYNHGYRFNGVGSSSRPEKNGKPISFDEVDYIARCFDGMEDYYDMYYPTNGLTQSDVDSNLINVAKSTIKRVDPQHNEEVFKYKVLYDGTVICRGEYTTQHIGNIVNYGKNYNCYYSDHLYDYIFYPNKIVEVFGYDASYTIDEDSEYFIDGTVPIGEGGAYGYARYNNESEVKDITTSSVGWLEYGTDVHYYYNPIKYGPGHIDRAFIEFEK